MRTKTALSILLVLTFAALAKAAVQPAASTEAVQVIGFGDIKKNAKGTLKLEDGTLSFTSNKTDFNVTTGSIVEVVTGNDTQRAIRGAVGTISQFAPYGAGRALSLFRDKIDTLTLEYRDANGALHGAVFTMAEGKAEPFKKDLLAQGAQTTMPVAQISKPSSIHSGNQEQQ